MTLSFARAFMLIALISSGTFAFSPQPGSVPGRMRRRFDQRASAAPQDVSKEQRETQSSESYSEEDSSTIPRTPSDESNIVKTPNVTTDWTVGGSFGSFLLKRQREEIEELRRIGINETKHFLEQATAEVTSALQPTKPMEPHDTIGDMDREAIRELDDSVSFMSGTESSFMDGIEVLPLSSLYSALSQPGKVEVLPEETDTGLPAKPKLAQRLRLRARKISALKRKTEERVMPLSRPEHYTDRIGRDMRHLAVSISSNVQNPWQWRMFVEENGGILPLVECLQESARFVNIDQFNVDFSESQFLSFVEEYEESLMMACTTCRSLRDLCALSPELSSVISDDLLRADAAELVKLDPDGLSHDGVVSDLVSILKHTTDAEAFYKRLYRQRRKLTARGARTFFGLSGRKKRREARRRCTIYVLQLFLAMAVASDDAVEKLRATRGLEEAILACSSYARKEQTRRWLRYPVEVLKRALRSSGTSKLAEENEGKRRPFVAAASIGGDLTGMMQGTANQVLASIGHNQWIPKIPGQRGLRVLCLDGGGSRGIVAATTLVELVQSMGGVEVCDSFDIIAGTSTGAIIAFLLGLRRESARKAKERYNELIKRIFVKTAMSTPMLLFTTATYDEVHFTNVLKGILGDTTMLESRVDPAVPLVCAISSKMSSTPTHAALFRNYNYAEGELPDTFVVDPQEARSILGLPREVFSDGDVDSIVKTARTPSMPGLRTGEGSRHPGSFRVLQRVALRASTAAPTVFKPVSMGGEIYCDGGMVASNPSAVAIHEARTLFPNAKIELLVSIGTGGFVEERNSPRFGWDGIIGQIVNSATDAESIHHILEDILGTTTQLGRSSISKTRYIRLNPVVGSPDKFPIDVTDPELLEELSRITEDYLDEPEQRRKLKEIGDILEGRRWWRRLLP